MNLREAHEMAVRGRLYPSVILHGGVGEERRQAALDIGRTLLCGAAPTPAARRIAWPGNAEGLFHPDFQVLERDLRTATSVEATRGFLKGAQLAPFEAGAQVFVVASAETLTPEAANALLKTLEEPPQRTPRHFLLLAPSQFDLLPTLRSRSLAVYLGGAGRPGEESVGPVAEGFARALGDFRRTAAGVDLMAAAGALAEAGDWSDPRAEAPWAVASAAVVATADTLPAGDPMRRRLLALAAELLDGPRLRVRGIAPLRILEGRVVGCLLRTGGGR